ncbi:hypothetical protein F5B21DRAFT_476531 [Xylaria acuta]|nr:hypothetical protein F5B21DRAFT_476531 [Xylaria acuta]
MSSQEVEDAVAEVEQLLDDLKQGYVDVSQLRNDLKQREDTTQQIVNDLRRRRGEVRGRIDQLALQKRQLEEQTAKLKDDSDKFDIVRWRRATESYKQARFDNALHWLIAMEKGETPDRLRNMSLDHKAAILDLERQITAAKLNKAEESLKLRDAEVSKTTDELNSMSNTIRTLDEDKKSSDTRVAELETSAKALQQRHDAVKAQHNTAQSEINMLSRRVEELEDGIARKEDRLVAQASEVTRLAAANKDLQDELTRKDAEISKQKRDSAQKDTDLAQAGADLVRNRADLEQKNAELEHVKDDCARKNARLSHHITTLEHKEADFLQRNTDLALLLMGHKHRGQDVDCWLPFINSLQLPAPATQPPINQYHWWTVVPSWKQQDPPPSSPTWARGLLESVVLLYGEAVANQWDEDGCAAFLTIIRCLEVTEVAPVAMMVELLRRLLTNKTQGCDSRNTQLGFFLGTLQIVDLMRLRWPETKRLADIESQCQHKFNDSPPDFQPIHDLVAGVGRGQQLGSAFGDGGRDGEIPPVLSAIPHKYCPEQKTLLVAPTTTSSSVWALDLRHHTIWLVNKEKGDFHDNDGSYWLEAPQGKDIMVPSTPNDLDFIFDCLSW